MTTVHLVTRRHNARETCGYEGGAGDQSRDHTTHDPLRAQSEPPVVLSQCRPAWKIILSATLSEKNGSYPTGVKW